MQITPEINAGLVQRPALEGFDRPPRSLPGRFRHYIHKYGFSHAILSYIGRQSFRTWQLMGPLASRAYLHSWLGSSGPKILNLGGGNAVFDRWLTADVVPHADVYMNVTRPFPLPDQCLDVVYSEEVIEHMPVDAGRRMLLECRRTLKPGGWIRVKTPSLDYFARRALKAPDHVKELNDIFYCHNHRQIYSEAELRQELAAAGFINLRLSRYREPESHLGWLDSHPERHTFAPPEWSQYWEGRNPAEPVD